VGRLQICFAKEQFFLKKNNYRARVVGTWKLQHAVEGEAEGKGMVQAWLLLSYAYIII
jgi:hypothetical protein